jgi:hypothetical protein
MRPYATSVRGLPLLLYEALTLDLVLQVAVTLISARIANVMVPQLYKDAIDTLSGSVSHPRIPFFFFSPPKEKKRFRYGDRLALPGDPGDPGRYSGVSRRCFRLSFFKVLTYPDVF